LKCEKRDCSRTKNITSITGLDVCSYCEVWRVECEGRYLLSLPLYERRSALDARSSKRGEKSIKELKFVMLEIHNAKKHR